MEADRKMDEELAMPADSAAVQTSDLLPLHSGDFLPLHGGDVVAAAQRYGIAQELWLDLSTGINPECYPLGKIDSAAFQQLPYIRPEFVNAARSYYGVDDFVAVAGTQIAIELLPKLLAPYPVLLADVGYQEHHQHWQAQTPVSFYPAFDQEEARNAIDKALVRNNRQHVVVINPNNPTGLCFKREQLLVWAKGLAEGAMLIVDEAFIDVSPEQSLLHGPLSDSQSCHQPGSLHGTLPSTLPGTLPNNVIVLRSFGKFFGLAGLRLGFVFAQPALLQSLRSRLPLWQVNGPAQALAIKALTDEAWQREARANITSNARLTADVLAPLWQRLKTQPLATTGLFLSLQLGATDAQAIADFFARQGILLRVIAVSDDCSILRIGLLSKVNRADCARLSDCVTAYGEFLQTAAAEPTVIKEPMISG